MELRNGRVVLTQLSLTVVQGAAGQSRDPRIHLAHSNLTHLARSALSHRKIHSYSVHQKPALDCLLKEENPSVVEECQVLVVSGCLMLTRLPQEQIFLALAVMRQQAQQVELYC